MADWTEDLKARLASFKLPAADELRIIEEVSRHLDDRVAELRHTGVTVDEARRLALDEVSDDELRRGGWDRLRLKSAMPAPGAPSRTRWFSSLWQDLRYTVTSLRRTPAFTLTVVATLALTIGPTTAILSVGNWLLWRPAPGIAQPDRLAVMQFAEWRDDGSYSPRFVSALNIDDISEASQTIASIAGWQEGASVSVAAEDAPPRHVGSAHATVNFFELLGVRPAAGRAFTQDDDRPPFGSPVVMLSDMLARGLFGTAEAAIGQPVTVNGRRLSVIGVMPHGFAGTRPFVRVDVWIPSLTYYHVRHFSDTYMQSRGGRGTSGIFYDFVVRLAPDATVDALQAELDVLVPSLAERYPNENGAFTTTRARAYPGLDPHERLREQLAGLVRNLLVVGGVLLVLGCANVANLLIFRGVRRQHQRAVRLALGASRNRLVQLLLIESCVLAIAGAAVGVGLAVWLKQLMQTLLLPGVLGANADVTVPIDVRVLALTLGVSLGCGLIAGFVPAWVGSSFRIASALGRGGVRTSAGGARMRSGFAVVQLALSLALVTNAVLLVATLRHFTSVDAGFDPHGVSVHYVSLSDHGYTTERAMAYGRELLERLSLDRTVQAASLSTGHPPRSLFRDRILDPRSGGQVTIDVWHDFVADDYFRTIGQPILLGRTFSRDEAMMLPDPGSVPVVLGEALARRLFGDVNPIGRRAGVRSDPARFVVVGVARDIQSPESLLAGEAALTMYTPFAHGSDTPFVTRPVLMIRSDRPVHEVASRVQTHATAIDPTLPLHQARVLADVVAQPLATRRAYAWVLSLLGAMGFVLAAVGLYGLLAQTVSERTREFGIRMALGAARTNVMGLVLKQAVWITVIGGVAGLGLAVFGSRIVEAQLFGVTRLEPWVYVTSAAGLAIVVLAASLWPARSATRVNPVEALRAE